MSSYIDALDDLALPQKPYRVVACLAVYGRVPLLIQTIKRLYQKNGVYKVICAGDGVEEKKFCKENGVEWVNISNKPLGRKWNAAFMRAKDFDPDAVLYIGSSDWVSDNWIHTMRPYVDDHEMVGVPGMHVLHVGNEMKAMKWPGYIGRRSQESIGAGRMLSRKLMELIKWQPFDPRKPSSLDGSMKSRCMEVGIGDYIVRDPSLTVVSISTDRWKNFHQFDDHESGRLPSEKIEDVDGFLKDFPEAYQIFK